MRLPEIALKSSSSSTKWGRLVPSLVRVSQPPRIGAQAVTSDDRNDGTLISSVKRLLGRKRAELDPHSESMLCCEITADEKGEILLMVETTSGTTIQVTPVQVLGMLLRGMREAAETYLQRYAIKKDLDVPGACLPSPSYPIRNVVMGVPAHFSKRQTRLVEEAARLGGFDGTVSTCLESTAAAMAYGLTLQETSKDSTIMVLDMGGGTSDITVARRSAQNADVNEEEEEDMSSSGYAYQVLVTEGEERLGGDDIDQVLLDYCLQKSGRSTLLSRDATMKLLQSCRKAKEMLSDIDAPSPSQTLMIPNDDDTLVSGVEIDQGQFEHLLNPWLDKARSLIRRTLVQLERVSPGASISEVILVGGTTRIRAIRRVVQDEFFPNVEIGVSLNPMSSVAQGLAIQAALISKQVPVHQLRSALMLDCIPHAIGVLLDNNATSSSFVEILQRNTPLPAKGSTTFTLADKFQPGVTMNVVERVGTSPAVYEPISRDPFTFLLRRLSNHEYADMTSRTIEVGMMVDREGCFTVSIFDELDPDQVRKRERYESQRGRIMGYHHQEDIGTILRTLWQDLHLSSDQSMLIGLLVATLVMYLAVKVGFKNELYELRNL